MKRFHKDRRIRKCFVCRKALRTKSMWVKHMKIFHPKSYKKWKKFQDWIKAYKAGLPV
jgi:hypothetical protein